MAGGGGARLGGGVGFSLDLAALEPRTDPVWAYTPSQTKAQFRNEAVRVATAAWDASRARGLDRFGAPLARLSYRTIRYRRSAMGPAAKHAPPLIPAYDLSRTRSYLRSRIIGDEAWFYWKHDFRTGGSWGRILDYHRTGGGVLPVRDVIGFSEAEFAEVQRKMAEWWAARRRPGHAPAGGPVTSTPAGKKPILAPRGKGQWANPIWQPMETVQNPSTHRDYLTREEAPPQKTKRGDYSTGWRQFTATKLPPTNPGPLAPKPKPKPTPKPKRTPKPKPVPPPPPTKPALPPLPGPSTKLAEAERLAREAIEATRAAARLANKPKLGAAQWEKDNWSDHPDLVLPFSPIDRRLASYTLGDAKAAAMQSLRNAAAQRHADIITELDQAIAHEARYHTHLKDVRAQAKEARHRRDFKEAYRLEKYIREFWTKDEGKQVLEAKDRLYDERFDVNIQAREAMRRVLSLDASEQLDLQASACGPNAKSDDGPLSPVVASSDLEKQVDAGLAWLKQITAQGDTSQVLDQRVGWGSGITRAHHTIDPDYDIQLGEYSRAYTVVHEFSHAIDAEVKTRLKHVVGDIERSAFKTSKAFLDYRTAGETPEYFDQLFPGDGYKPHEKGSPDDFEKATRDQRRAYYAGKKYSHDAAEVLSIGTELLYEDPVGFATRDPEWFKFVVGVLDGSLR